MDDGDDLVLDGFWIFALVISYLQCLWEQDFSEGYREYALLLSALQGYYPNQRLVVKAPDHMPQLDLMLDALPGARIVQLHRDPTTCCLSLSSLFYSTHIALSETVCPRHMDKANQDMMVSFIQANHLARKNPPVDRMVLDLNFENLVEDPLRKVQGIYKHFGLKFKEDYKTRLGRFIKRQNNQSR